MENERLLTEKEYKAVPYSIFRAYYKNALPFLEAQDAKALKELWEWLEFHRKTGHLNKLVIENLLMPALEKGKLPEI